MPPRYAAVLLDLYDTLVWTEWPELRERICQRLGVSAADLLRAFSVTRPARSIGAYPDAEADMGAVLAELGINDPAVTRDLAELEAGYFAGDRVHVHDDALPTVRELRGRGAATAIVSNCSHSTRPELEKRGLISEFDAVILSFEVGACKPDPAIYQEALERLGGIAPEEALFVDDQARYCDGARAIGIDTRLIVREGAAPPEGFAPSTNGHTVIRDLSALL